MAPLRIGLWRSKLLGKVLAGLVASGIGIGWWCGQKLPLAATPVGCGVQHSNGSCELFAHRKLRILLEGDSDIAISVWHGLRPLTPQHVEWEDHARLLSLAIPSGHAALRLLLRRGLCWRLVRLKVEESHSPDWLLQAREQWSNGQGTLAQATLEARLAQPITPRDQADTLGILARIDREQDRVDRARRRFYQALAADRRAGLVSNEIDDLMSLARLLNRRYHQPAAAQALWAEREDLLVQMPEMQPWRLLHMSIYRQKAGDMRAAMGYVDEGKILARRFGDQDVLMELISQQATLLNQLGRLSESEVALQEHVEADPEACRQAELLADQAWLRILNRRAQRPESPRDPKQNVQPLLDKALALVHKRCAQPNLEAKILTYQGHAELLDGSYLTAATQVDAAQQALRKRDPNLEHPAPELEIEWLDIQGRAAIGQKDWRAAQRSYSVMVERARILDDYEAVWRANIGLAWASEQDEPKRACQLYQQAETYLDERSLSMPLGIGRGPFLGRFEWGTRLYIDLLHRLGLDGDAMMAARHARARGLWALSLIERIKNIDSATRARWDAAMSRYGDERRELDQIVIAGSGASRAKVAEAEQRRAAQTKRLWGSLDKALAVLGERPGRPQFQLPAPHEVVLTCHPAKTGWLCFAADRKGVSSSRLNRLDIKADNQTLATQLLAPFAAMLKDAQQVRIIAYGELRQVDIHRLPFAGKSLGEAREVVYALDAPWYARRPQTKEAPAPGLAVLLFDPDETLQASRRSAGWIAKSLRAAGWQLRMQVGSTPGPSDAPDSAGGAKQILLTKRDELLRQLGHAELFHYVGHADFATNGVWEHSLRTTDQGGVLVGDILLLDRVPPRVSLFACNSGLSAEEIGGLEGLGLAQSFLLRGSRWVLATVRNVDDALASAVAIEFYRRLSESGADDRPYGALREAVWHAKQTLHLNDPGSLNGLTPDRDLGAFRIFVR